MKPKKKKTPGNNPLELLASQASSQQGLPPIPDTSNPEAIASMMPASLPPITNAKAPDDVALAAKSVGDHSYDGWCQAFVEHSTLGKTGVYPSAIDAWQQQQDKAVPGIDGIKPGDPIYFAPNDSNEGYGHTGIYAGDNKFISATDNGIKTYDLNDWGKLTGQQVLGYLKDK